jgi:hypothetical protein
MCNRLCRNLWIIFAQADLHRVQNIFGNLRRQYPEVIGKNNKDHSQDQHPLIAPEIFI